MTRGWRGSSCSRPGALDRVGSEHLAVSPLLSPTRLWAWDTQGKMGPEGLGPGPPRGQPRCAPTTDTGPLAWAPAMTGGRTAEILALGPPGWSNGPHSPPLPVRPHLESCAWHKCVFSLLFLLLGVTEQRPAMTSPYKAQPHGVPRPQGAVTSPRFPAHAARTCTPCRLRDSRVPHSPQKAPLSGLGPRAAARAPSQSLLHQSSAFRAPWSFRCKVALCPRRVGS